MTGGKPERWVRQTDFSNDEAVGYLADRLARLGRRGRAGDARAPSPAPRSRSARATASPSTGSRRPPTEAARGPARHRQRLATQRLTRAGARPHAGAAPRRRASARRSEDARGVPAATPGDPRAARRPPDRRQGRLVVADLAPRAGSTRRGSTRWSTCSPRAGAGARSSWSPPAPSPPGSRRSACPAARATSPRSRPPRASGRCCWSSGTPTPSPATRRTVGQVLLTAEDIIRRAHYRNARRTLDRLLALGVVPVVNENDAVATDEIRFGDNDRLAALVAHLVARRPLVLLSDVDGRLRRATRAAGAGPGTRLDDVRGDGRPRRASTAPRGHRLGRRRLRRDGRRRSTPPGSPTAAGVRGAGRRSPATGRAPSPASRSAPASTPPGAGAAARLLWLAHASDPARPARTSTPARSRAVVERRMSLLPAGDHRRRRRLRRR